MKTFLKKLSKNGFFYSYNILILSVMTIFLLIFSRADGFIWLNQIHNWPLNFFFDKITFLGDGIFIIIVSLIILLFIKKHTKLAFIILLSYISSGLFVQIIKGTITAPRPSVYFEMHHYNYYLDVFATSRKGLSSFPSGHTASFLAFATVLAGYCKRKFVCILSFLLSVLIGYSRIYLANHFLIDVFAGAIIGVTFGLLSEIWVDLIISKLRRRKQKKHLKILDNFPLNSYLNNQ